jgi:hypothetical protein
VALFVREAAGFACDKKIGRGAGERRRENRAGQGSHMASLPRAEV